MSDGYHSVRLIWQICFVYLDHIIALSQDPASDLDQIYHILTLVGKEGVKLTGKKYFFIRNDVNYLRNVLRRGLHDISEQEKALCSVRDSLFQDARLRAGASAPRESLNDGLPNHSNST